MTPTDAELDQLVAEARSWLDFVEELPLTGEKLADRLLDALAAVRAERDRYCVTLNQIGDFHCMTDKQTLAHDMAHAARQALGDTHD